jgi:hypothetical protein
VLLELLQADPATPSLTSSFQHSTSFRGCWLVGFKREATLAKIALLTTGDEVPIIVGAAKTNRDYVV